MSRPDVAGMFGVIGPQDADQKEVPPDAALTNVRPPGSFVPSPGLAYPPGSFVPPPGLVHPSGPFASPFASPFGSAALVIQAQAGTAPGSREQEAEVRRLRAEVARLTARNEELMSERDRARSELRSERKTSRDNAVAHRTTVATLLESVEQHRLAREEAEASRDDAQEKLDNAEAEIQRLRVSLDEMGSTIAVLRETITALENENRTLMSQLSTLQTEVKQSLEDSKVAKGLELALSSRALYTSFERKVILLAVANLLEAGKEVKPHTWRSMKLGGKLERSDGTVIPDVKLVDDEVRRLLQSWFPGTDAYEDVACGRDGFTYEGDSVAHPKVETSSTLAVTEYVAKTFGSRGALLNAAFTRAHQGVRAIADDLNKLTEVGVQEKLREAIEVIAYSDNLYRGL